MISNLLKGPKNKSKVITISLCLMIVYRLDAQTQEDSAMRFLSTYFNQSNPNTITHLWSRIKQDSIRISNLETELNSTQNAKTKIENELIDLKIDYKILQNNYQELINTKAPPNIIFATTPKPDSHLSRHDDNNMPSIKENIFVNNGSDSEGEIRKYYIVVDTIKSSYYRISKFTIYLSSEAEHSNKNYIELKEGAPLRIPPSVTDRPEFEIIDVNKEQNQNSWTYKYYTKEIKEPIITDLVIPGKSILSNENGATPSKVEIVISETTDSILLKIYYWFLWHIQKTEVVMAGLIVFIANAKQIINHLREFYNFLLRFFKKKLV